MTPEEMQERILELEEQNRTLTSERDTLSQNNEELTKTLDDVRTLNQKYFLRLSATKSEEEEEEEEEKPSCVDFAKSIASKF